jgi:anti-sigma regulatory factor (Ser/Thr protein kinase)
MSHASAGFRADLASVGEARRFARRALVDLGAEDLEFEACQVVSELATNSVIHAATAFEVELIYVGNVLQVRVSDHSPRIPVPKAHSARATTGRGLRLVAMLADDWGTELRPDSKTVWCVLRPDRARTSLPLFDHMASDLGTAAGRRGGPSTGRGICNFASWGRSA